MISSSWFLYDKYLSPWCLYPGTWDIKAMLGGEKQDIRIDGVIYAAYELLDMEVVDMQTDLFDNGLIRMKADETDEQTFVQTMWLNKKKKDKQKEIEKWATTYISMTLSPSTKTSKSRDAR